MKNELISSNQLSFFKEKNRNLTLKTYIQPFEVELAYFELHGLIGKSLAWGNSDIKKSDLFIEKKFISQLQNRLAYWESVGLGNNSRTEQIKLEYTQTGNKFIEGDTPHRTRRLRYGPHDFHEYRGKFFPQLVRSLINSVGLKKGTILDPMCGSGTTLVETAVLGLNSLGLDMNPLSVEISKAKTVSLSISPDIFKRKLTLFLKNMDSKQITYSKTGLFWSQEDFEYLQNWFHLDALNEISFILKEFQKLGGENIALILKVWLSNILRKNSYQKLADLRVRKEVKPYLRRQLIEDFKNEISRQLVKFIPYIEVLQSSNKSFKSSKIEQGDSREISKIYKKFVGKVDCIITSPPYATALPYLDTDRLSLVALDLLPRKSHKSKEKLMIGTREVTEKQRRELWENYCIKKHELPLEISSLIDSIAKENHLEGIGFRRKNLPALLGKYFLDMKEVMQQSFIMLKSGGYAFYVVGNNNTEVLGKKIEIATDKFLYLIGSSVGFKQVQYMPMELLHSRDIFKENRGTSETILVFKKD